MIDRRKLIAAVAALPFAPALADAQEAPGETLEQQCRLMLQRQDWTGLDRYAEDDRRLLASGAKTGIVFMGDSITAGWRDKRPAFFRPGRVCRGIGGQTTPQMVLRMLQDVVQLKPRFVHIMGGTNDIAGNTGAMTVAQSADNIRAMVTLARANRIGVLLASVPPADHFPWRPGLETVKPIRAINAWAKQFCAGSGIAYVDYTAVLADANGAMRPGMAYDGVHPGEAGYAAMEAVLGPMLKARGI